LCLYLLSWAKSCSILDDKDRNPTDETLAFRKLVNWSVWPLVWFWSALASGTVIVSLIAAVMTVVSAAVDFLEVPSMAAECVLIAGNSGGVLPESWRVQAMLLPPKRAILFRCYSGFSRRLHVAA
jgi:hypothetical protein